MSFIPEELETQKSIPTNEHSDTSVHSRDILDRKKNNYRERILNFIKDHCGSTCDQVEVGLELRHQTASCFIRFLTQDGFLRDSGERRITRTGRRAIVWKTL